MEFHIQAVHFYPMTIVLLHVPLIIKLYLNFKKKIIKYGHPIFDQEWIDHPQGPSCCNGWLLLAHHHNKNFLQKFITEFE
jgi:hypothetical protein